MLLSGPGSVTLKVRATLSVGVERSLSVSLSILSMLRSSMKSLLISVIWIGWLVCEFWLFLIPALGVN